MGGQTALNLAKALSEVRCCSCSKCERPLQVSLACLNHHRR